MTVLALLLLIPMTSINRRKGWELDPDRPRPAAAALTRFADTTDRALITAGRTLTRKPNPSPTSNPDPTATQDAASSDSRPRTHPHFRPRLRFNTSPTRPVIPQRPRTGRATQPQGVLRPAATTTHHAPEPPSAP